MRFPDFFIIGAQKSGTTTLWTYLHTHPDIHLGRVKEPRFFLYHPMETFLESTLSQLPPQFRDIYASVWKSGKANAISDTSQYLELFKNARPDQIIGEASPGYLAYPIAARAIAQKTPNAKLIAILRDPVSRAYSAYLHNIRMKLETLPFRTALDEELSRPLPTFPYFRDYILRSRYCDQIQTYWDLFPKENLSVLLLDDLERDLPATLQKIFRFLNVNTDVTLTSSLHFNVGDSADPVISNDDRLYLRNLFESEISKLSRMLHRDLTPWLDGRKLDPQP